MNAPMNCPAISIRPAVISAPGAKNPWITPAGLSEPGPPNACETYTPLITAKAQPAVITIQPAFCALDLFSKTPATTPSPSRIRIIVPNSSPKNGDILVLLSTVRGSQVRSPRGIVLDLQRRNRL